MPDGTEKYREAIPYLPLIFGIDKVKAPFPLIEEVIKSDYDPDEKKLPKYALIHKTIIKHLNIKGGQKARDICCHNSHKWSTAGVLLDLGFKTYSYGNNINFMNKRNNLFIYYCKDVTKLSFEGNINDNSLGEYVLLSIVDACGYINPDFIMNVIKHSYLTILTVTHHTCRTIGYRGKRPSKYTLFGKPYPHGKGSLNKFISILIEEAKKRGYKAEMIGTTPDHNRFIKFINERR